MRPIPQTTQQLPLNIVGSTKFGRYPKISTEQTFNMIISDNALVPYAGYKLVAEVVTDGIGRGIYSSTRYGHLILVIEDTVYAVSSNMSPARIGSLDTFSGDVFIDENNTNQIAICDKQSIWIFDYVANTFTKAYTPSGTTLDFLPGYITYQDGYFISVDTRTASWRLSAPGNGKEWPATAVATGLIQTKPDTAVAALRVPGRGNMLFVFGKTVTEQWVDVGAQLFPYQRNSSLNIDFGCLNPATIASNENYVVWLASNEKSGPVIVYSTGGDITQISNDGINFKFANLQHPTDAYGFLFKQDGHMFYQITFPRDNLSLTYDFTTQKFFTLCDRFTNYHIAKRVAFFNNTYYFVSLKDGNLYELNSKYTTFDGEEIPRIRVCPNVRQPNSSSFAVNNLTFPMECGEDLTDARVDLTVSRDGGATFGNAAHYDMSAQGVRKSKVVFWNLGVTNDFVPQFRFWGEGRFVCFDGQMEVYQ
jgi:hypothetical protein